MIALFASKSWPISRKKEKKSYFVHFRNSNVWQMVWKTVSYNVWSKFILRIPEVNCLADVAEPNLVGTCSGLLKISRLELVIFFFFRYSFRKLQSQRLLCGLWQVFCHGSENDLHASRRPSEAGGFRTWYSPELSQQSDTKLASESGWLGNWECEPANLRTTYCQQQH